MRTHALAASLEQFAKLLRQLPDMEVGEVIPSLLQLARGGNSKKRPRKAPGLAARLSVSDVLERLQGMSPTEVEQFLLRPEEAIEPKTLRAIADRLSIPVSARQNRAALVNAIARQIEHRRMDTIIRSRDHRDPHSIERRIDSVEQRLTNPVVDPKAPQGTDAATDEPYRLSDQF